MAVEALDDGVEAAAWSPGGIEDISEAHIDGLKLRRQLQVSSSFEVDADSDEHSCIDRIVSGGGRAEMGFEENTGELTSLMLDIVGPLELDARSTDVLERFVHGGTGYETELL